MLSSPKQTALEVSAGSASSVRPWTERSGRPATTSGRIVAFDRCRGDLRGVASVPALGHSITTALRLNHLTARLLAAPFEI
jgi:hypothetical protein